jgi:hypothetical protein
MVRRWGLIGHFLILYCPLLGLGTLFKSLLKPD